MTDEENALADRIVEYLRGRREPASLSEIKFAVGESLMKTAEAVSKLDASGDIVSSSEPPNGRVYFRIARSE